MARHTIKNSLENVSIDWNSEAPNPINLETKGKLVLKAISMVSEP